MKVLMTIIGVLLFFNLANAQKYYTSSESQLIIEGTSTIHDWECDVNEFSAEANYVNSIFSGIEFSAKVKSIKSGKSSMDKNIYNAMNESKYPEIVFKSSKMTVSGGKVRGTGNLTMYGNTRQIPIELDMSGTSTLSISGQIKIKMTDYGIDPPVAVFGTIKTGNELTIIIDFKLKQK